MLYLRLPIAIECSSETISGEIYLPSRMRGMSICMDRSGNPGARQRMCEMLGEIGMGTLLLQAPEECGARHVIAAIDWVRTRHLLRCLPINLIATETDAFAARKAAQRRPASVTAVLSTGFASPRFAAAHAG